MANFCNFDIRVKGKRGNALLFCYSVISCDGTNIYYAHGTDEEYEVRFNGVCKWSLDAYVKDGWNGREITEDLNALSDNALAKLGEKCMDYSLRAKSKVLGCEVMAHSWSDESDFDSFEHYVDGECIDSRTDEYMPEYKFDWATLNYVHREAVLSYDERMAAWWAKTLPVWKNEIPFDHIATIECKDKVFAFTGLCDWAVKNMLGIEKQFADDYWHTREWIGELGGICQKDVTLRCDYLIVGLHAEKTNRSVETAIRYRDSGNSRIKIIPEDELLKILEKEAAEISVLERVSVNPLEYIEDHPEISISGKKFVFTGLSAFKSDEKNMPIVQKLMARGGLHREKISGVTDYLVVCSEEPSEHKLNQVITLQKAGKPIQIIRLKDFEVALNRTKEDGPQILNGETSATSEHKDSLLKAAEEKKLQRLEKAKERQRLAEEAARQKEEHRQEREQARLVRAETVKERKEALAREKIQREEAEKAKKAVKEEQLRQAAAERERKMQTDVLYRPGKEPDNIRKRIDNLFAKLDSAYPDKKICKLQTDHKKWAETVTQLYRLLGYPDGRAFLEAYGYEVVAVENKGGRPSTNNYDVIIEELKHRYPDGAKFQFLSDLEKENGDLPIKTLSNNAKKLFGMSLKDYLKELGIMVDLHDVLKMEVTQQPVKPQQPIEEKETWQQAKVEVEYFQPVEEQKRADEDFERKIQLNALPDVLETTQTKIQNSHENEESAPGADEKMLASEITVAEKLQAVIAVLTKRYLTIDVAPRTLTQMERENPDISFATVKSWTYAVFQKTAKEYLEANGLLNKNSPASRTVNAQKNTGDISMVVSAQLTEEVRTVPKVTTFSSIDPAFSEDAEVCKKLILGVLGMNGMTIMDMRSANPALKEFGLFFMRDCARQLVTEEKVQEEIQDGKNYFSLNTVHVLYGETLEISENNQMVKQNDKEEKTEIQKVKEKAQAVKAPVVTASHIKAPAVMPSELLRDYEAEKEEIRRRYNQKIDELSARIKKGKDRLNALKSGLISAQQALDAAFFLAFGKKRVLREEIASLNREEARLRQEQNQLQSDLEKVYSEKKKEMDELDAAKAAETGIRQKE